MGHFRDATSLFCKTRPSAKPFLWWWFFYYHANKTHFHKKGFALGLVLRVRVFGTRKWPISYRLAGWPAAGYRIPSADSWLQFVSSRYPLVAYCRRKFLVLFSFGSLETCQRENGALLFERNSSAFIHLLRKQGLIPLALTCVAWVDLKRYTLAMSHARTTRVSLLLRPSKTHNWHLSACYSSHVGFLDSVFVPS